MGVISLWKKVKSTISRPFKEREAFIREHLKEDYYLGKEDGMWVSALYSIGDGNFVRIFGKPGSRLGLNAFRAVQYKRNLQGALIETADNLFSFSELKRHMANLYALYGGHSPESCVHFEEGLAAKPYNSLPWVKAKDACEPYRSGSRVTVRRDGFEICRT